ncbi:hypothetical protein NPIL_230351 [Nephila pilipes]|uniref:Uncharacterized protein n=1 Tax=Nephila pilipes TaxID=299642 RepID=A0A8X6U0H2_NEPPI|nr:hypothetical protein NPIL_230351 [Nephila pilipes]
MIFHEVFIKCDIHFVNNSNILPNKRLNQRKLLFSKPKRMELCLPLRKHFFSPTSLNPSASSKPLKYPNALPQLMRFLSLPEEQHSFVFGHRKEM